MRYSLNSFHCQKEIDFVSTIQISIISKLFYYFCIAIYAVKLFDENISQKEIFDANFLVDSFHIKKLYFSFCVHFYSL